MNYTSMVIFYGMLSLVAYNEYKYCVPRPEIRRKRSCKHMTAAALLGRMGSTGRQVTLLTFMLYSPCILIQLAIL
jgi:hypothetical protein